MKKGVIHLAKKAIVACIGVLDAVLLVLIIVSLATGWRVGTAFAAKQKGEVTTAAVSETAEESDTGTGEQSEPQENALSTSNIATIPDSEGFMWNKGWLYLSSSAKKVKDFDALTGGWRAYMVSNPQEALFTDYFNVTITGAEKNTIVVCNWGYHIEGETEDLSGQKTQLTGSFSKGSLKATGQGTLTITKFYEDGGKQYAEGSFVWPDGSKGYLGLVRG